MDPRGGARVDEVYRRKKKQGKRRGDGIRIALIVAVGISCNGPCGNAIVVVRLYVVRVHAADGSILEVLLCG